MKILLLSVFCSMAITANAFDQPLTFSGAGANYYASTARDAKYLYVPQTPYLEKQVNLLRHVVRSAAYAKSLTTFTYGNFLGLRIAPGTGNDENVWALTFVFTEGQLGPRGPQNTRFYLHALVKETSPGVFEEPKFMDVVKPMADIMRIQPPVKPTPQK